MSRTNPFVGPRALLADRAIHGRDRELDELVDLVLAQRLVLLHAPSGAGKTSILEAGLQRALEGEIRTIHTGIRVGLPPHDAGQRANRYAWSVIQSIQRDERPSLPIDDFSAALTRLVPVEDGGVCLLFDQFEELVTADPTDHGAKHAFCRVLDGFLRERVDVFVVFAVREDYLGALEPLLQELPGRLRTRFRLDFLTRDAARRVIVETAAEAGGETFSPAVVEAILTGLCQVTVQTASGTLETHQSEFVEPMHLQVVCRRLWADAAAGKPVEAGGRIDDTIGAALAAHYALTVEQAAHGSRARERALRDWVVRRLIGRDGVRTPIAGTAEGLQGVELEEVQALVDGYILRKEVRNGVQWYELAHDRLTMAIRKDNAAWDERILAPYQRRARFWHEAGRPMELLLVGAELRRAARAASDGEVVENDTDRDFLEQSADAHRKSQWLRAAAALGLVSLLSALALGVTNRLDEADSKRRRVESEVRKKQAENANLAAELHSASGWVSEKSTELGEKYDLLKELGSELSVAKSAAIVSCSCPAPPTSAPPSTSPSTLPSTDPKAVSAGVTAERLGRQALIDGRIDDAQAQYLVAKKNYPGYRNVYEVNTKILTPSAVDSWRAADAPTRNNIHRKMLEQLLAFGWGLPEADRKQVSAKLATLRTGPSKKL